MGSGKECFQPNTRLTLGGCFCSDLASIGASSQSAPRALSAPGPVSSSLKLCIIFLPLNTLT